MGTPDDDAEPGHDPDVELPAILARLQEIARIEAAKKDAITRRDELIERAVSQGATTELLAATTNLSRGRVSQIRKRLGIAGKRGGNPADITPRSGRLLLPDVFAPDELENLLGGQGLDPAEIDELPLRLAVLGDIVDALSASRDRVAIIGWLTQSTDLLGGHSAHQILSAGWHPDDPQIEQILELAAAEDPTPTDAGDITGAGDITDAGDGAQSGPAGS